MSGERTVAGWVSPTNPAGISYGNAKKVATLFAVDIDWIWRGEALPGQGSDQLDRIEARLEAIEEIVSANAEAVQEFLADRLERLASDVLEDSDGRELPPSETPGTQP